MVYSVLAKTQMNNSGQLLTNLCVAHMVDLFVSQDGLTNAEKVDFPKNTGPCRVSCF